MVNDKRISDAVIKRLPRYYRYLCDLLDSGVTRISSGELSRRMGVTASQIRQDLNNFGCFGQQGYGYNVELLSNEIRKILGMVRTYNLIIIGAGNLGQALCNYQNFAKRGYIFTAMFDINPDLIGTTINGVKVYDIADLRKYLQENEVDIAALALPRSNSRPIVQILDEEGIKGIWNFSHVDLKVSPDVVVENVHLTDSLMTLSYRLNNQVGE